MCGNEDGAQQITGSAAGPPPISCRPAAPPEEEEEEEEELHSGLYEGSDVKADSGDRRTAMR